MEKLPRRESGPTAGLHVLDRFPVRRSVSARRSPPFPPDARVGRALAELRKSLGLTQAELASRVYCDRSLIAQIETGRQRLSEDRYHEIAGALLTEARNKPPSTFAANVAMATAVIAYAIREDRTVEEERYLSKAMVAHEETLAAIKRLEPRWSEGDYSVAPEFTSPIVGLVLLYSDIEVDLLVACMHWWRPEEPTPIQLVGDSQLLYALFLANAVLASMSGESGTIRDMIEESIASRIKNEAPVDRLDVLAGIADEAVSRTEDSNREHYRSFIAALRVSLGVGTTLGVDAGTLIGEPNPGQ
jgi:transcriptional regulator with XRE-family HTH domain